MADHPIADNHDLAQRIALPLNDRITVHRCTRQACPVFFKAKKKRLEPEVPGAFACLVLPTLGPVAVIITRACVGQTIAIDRRGVSLAQWQ
jgi:hypothetical protein